MGQLLSPSLSAEVDYEAQVDLWVAKARKEHLDFAALVGALPGVYPGYVAASLRRQGIKTSFGESERLLRLDGPIPHPIDGDWRFHPDSWQLFKRLLAKRPVHELAVLACPSLVKPLLRTVKRISLADSNTQWQKWLPSEGVDVSWGDVSLAAQNWPHRFDAAIMDPPWYSFEFARFLSVGAAVLKEGAMLYVSFPSVGTRPGMALERTQMLRTARRFGLAHVSTRHSALKYATPFYEGSALDAACLPVLSSWRSADLLVFTRFASGYTEQMESAGHPWLAVSHGRLQLRIKPGGGWAGHVDPRLVHLIPGDVLPTVSQRDPRRRDAAVWTAGNRIFGCSSPDACYDVATATMHQLDPVGLLQERLGRPLAAVEIEYVTQTRMQLAELESLEARTYDAMHEDLDAAVLRDQGQIASRDRA